MMHTQSLEEFIRFVKNRAYDMNKRSGQSLTVSVSFTKNGHKNEIISHKERHALAKLAETILFQKPEQVEVELETKSKYEIHNYDMHGDFNNETIPINGLAAIPTQDIEAIVNKRMDEERKVMELKALKIKLQEQKDDLSQKLQEQKDDLSQKLQEQKEGLSKKQQEIEDLKTDIENKDQTIEDLEKTIESKKNFKYYAGMTGDILQSFGIQKEIIAKPLAGLLSGTTEEESKAIPKNSSPDASGIVEDEKTGRRQEMLSLIGEYLKGVDQNTLANIFSIFSEIENKPQQSELILAFLNQQKSK